MLDQCFYVSQNGPVLYTCKGQNLNAEQYKGLEAGLKALNWDLNVTTGTSSHAAPVQHNASMPLGASGDLVAILDTPGQVPKATWDKVAGIVDMMTSIDKQGSKLYEQMGELKTLSPKGSQLLNELEDVLVCHVSCCISWKPVVVLGI